MDKGIYLFCLAPAAASLDLKGTGIDGQPLFVERIGDCAAVLSEVSLDEFSGAGAEERMQDLSWVGPRACIHEEVILNVMDQSCVLPVRFGTVFSTMQALTGPLLEHQKTIAEFLQDMTGREEWTLKGILDKQKAKADMMAAKLQELEATYTSLPPGQRYFQEQRIKNSVEKDMSLRLRDMAKDIIRAMETVSLDFCERRLISRDVSGSDGDMFFHGAFLIDRGAVADMQALIAAWNRTNESRGLQVELSGPWPLYSFAPALHNG
jgi:hypothetical protein